MNLLCWLGIHRWKSEVVLEQTMSSGIRLFLDGNVCQRCEALQDPENVADVYAIMANNPGEIVIHPKLYRGDVGAKDE